MPLNGQAVDFSAGGDGARHASGSRFSDDSKLAACYGHAVPLPGELALRAPPVEPPHGVSSVLEGSVLEEWPPLEVCAPPLSTLDRNSARAIRLCARGADSPLTAATALRPDRNGFARSVPRRDAAPLGGGIESAAERIVAQGENAP